MSDHELVSAKAFPAKKFFVNMLTRDIDIPDAILDLLDNCVDGIIRSRKLSINDKENNKPYEGYYAAITINQECFEIRDNCGGIPLETAVEYAFMMGRDKSYDEDLPTVGMYGIGMKRAMFKIGRNSVVFSKTNENSFKVSIDKKWMESETDWTIPIELIDHSPIDENGTLIRITELNQPISDWFGSESFQSDFREKVSHHFSYIMEKGFKITVNNKAINPSPVKLLFDKNTGIAPYIYSAQIGDVKVMLQVGFSTSIPTDEEIELELTSRSSRKDSGWTIVCNDRVVLYKNTDYLTGWGEAGVPKFHYQFNGINGIVFFNSNNPESLPLNTTKRGIEHSSKMYLEVKNQMRIGTKIFTDYTNIWKKDREEEKQVRKNVKALDHREVERAIDSNEWKVISSNLERKEKVYKPLLPRPSTNTKYVQISFKREIKDVQKVSSYLFDDPSMPASQVGTECFDLILRGIEE